MDITLKGGPLDGEVVSIAVSSRTYTTRIENRHIVYDQSNERTERGQQVFIHRPARVPQAQPQAQTQTPS